MPTVGLKEILEFSKQKAIFNLLESGVDADFFFPMLNRLNTQVAQGGNIDDVISDLKKFITGTEEIPGALNRYVTQVMDDTLRQFSAAYTEAITDGLGMEFYKYVGTKIKFTRPFCVNYMNEYFHREEVEMLGNGKDPFTGGSLEGMGLTAGRIEGTNEINIFINRGGWNCRHAFAPLTPRFVPKLVLKRAVEKGYWKPSKTEKEKFL